MFGRITSYNYVPIRIASFLPDVAQITLFAALAIVLTYPSLPAWADKGVILSNNIWSVEVRAIEPQANPEIMILGHKISRAKHTWARMRARVSFQCQARKGIIEAVNPVISLVRPVLTPKKWGNLQGFSQLINIPATKLTLKPADIRQAKLDLSTGFSRPGCFSVIWTARFDKKGTVFTYQVNPSSGPNPIQNPPQNVQLDENMNDTLLGQTRICCCSFLLSDVKNNKLKQGEIILSTAAPTETIPEEFWKFTRASEYLKYIGIDWFAENISNPNPVDQRDPKTSWQGTHQLKQCTYQTVKIKRPGGAFSIRIKTNGPIPPGSKTNKPVATSFTIP